MKLLGILDGEGFESRILEGEDGRVEFKADGDIDADGAPHAYHPRNIGLDILANARDRNGRYVGILTDRAGRPLIQGPEDPAPGYYISATTYEHRDQPRLTQRRYLDAERVRFIVVPPLVITRTKGMVMGCKARVTDLRTGRKTDAMVGDRGPTRKTGELSLAAARALGIEESPRSGGIDEPVLLYELWPGVPAVLDGVTYKLQAS